MSHCRKIIQYLIGSPISFRCWGISWIPSVLWLAPFSLNSLGTTLGFQTVAGRTVMLTALLLQLISLAYYTSNMVSALTVGPSLPALNDLRDVHNDPAITFGFVKGTANTVDFRVGCSLSLEFFSSNVFVLIFFYFSSYKWPSDQICEKRETQIRGQGDLRIRSSRTRAIRCSRRYGATSRRKT